mgnify:CR=1 FL=1
MRGATGEGRDIRPYDSNFNPRSPCGERPRGAALARGATTFQSTLPVRGATCGYCRQSLVPQFQSTLPVRGATTQNSTRLKARKHFNPRSPCGERHRKVVCAVQARAISIHAPRAGSDVIHVRHQVNLRKDFNPRSPCGERPRSYSRQKPSIAFQSTLPVRGAT